MKNILFICHNGNRGGSENDLVQLMAAMKDRFKCHCVFPRNGLLVDDAKTVDVETHLVDQKSWLGYNRNNLWRVQSFLLHARPITDQLCEIIKKNDIRLVVTNTVIPIEGALAALACRVPHVWYIHELLGRDPKLISLFRLEFTYSFILQMSKTVVVVSEAVKEDITKWMQGTIGMDYPYDPNEQLKKIRVIHNGLRMAPRPLVNRNGSENVLAVGGICRRKGQLDLLRAAKIVCEQVPGATFDVVGRMWERDYYDQIVAELKQSNLGDRFKLWRRQDDLEPFYRKSAVFAMPSLCESFSVVLLEAMNVGLPIVATDCGGPREIIPSNTYGFLTTPGDYDSMASRIIYLLKNKDIADQMAVKANERVHAEFNYERKVQQVLQMVEENVK